MSVDLKTTISINKSILDENDQYVPIGNYYFLIKKMEDGLVTGELSCKGHFGEFTFSYVNVIKMMAIGQSRLARRSNLVEEGMPNYSSPITSPKNFNFPMINNYTEKSNEKIVLEKCIICLDVINNDKQPLLCGHNFHKNCIDNWKSEKNTCPCCRKTITYLNKINNKSNLNKYVLKNYKFSENAGTMNEVPSINSAIRHRRHTVSSDIRRRYNLRSRTTQI